MKENIKKIYKDSKPFLKGFFTMLGVVAIFDWVIAPGLTAQNTLINVLSLILAAIVSVVVGSLIITSLSKNSDNTFELSEEEQEKIMKNLKNKGLYTEKKEKNKDDGKVY